MARLYDLILLSQLRYLSEGNIKPVPSKYRSFALGSTIALRWQNGSEEQFEATFTGFSLVDRSNPKCPGLHGHRKPSHYEVVSPNIGNEVMSKAGSK